uniref:Uncharacterized protein n=1 Tax=Meloidogyne enterolobii TaxID=390850 RepID=A0A6V7V7X9_MELEN|nr:unnamed protein product [Meloidogyne enterolobii]
MATNKPKNNLFNYQKCLFIFLIFIKFKLLFSQFQLKIEKRNGCSANILQQCVEPLKAVGMPLNKNLVKSLLQISDIEMLDKYCSSYKTIMPCFAGHISQCGSSEQKEFLRQMVNAIQFLCDPYSSNERLQLLSNRKCIGKVLEDNNQLINGNKLNDCFNEYNDNINRCR